MASPPFEPFINVDGIQRVQKELSKMFEGDWISNMAGAAQSSDSDWRPRADVTETDDHFSYLIRCARRRARRHRCDHQAQCTQRFGYT